MIEEKIETEFEVYVIDIDNETAYNVDNISFKQKDTLNGTGITISGKNEYFALFQIMEKNGTNK